MYPNENLDLANPGLSPSDRATLSQIDNQPRSDGEAEKILFSLAPHSPTRNALSSRHQAQDIRVRDGRRNRNMVAAGVEPDARRQRTRKERAAIECALACRSGR